MVGDWSAAVSH